MLNTIKHLLVEMYKASEELMIPLENVFVPSPVIDIPSIVSSSIANPSIVSPSIVLTRYLYIKEDVLASLTMSILDKDYEQAVFWTCELYYSGFKEEVADYLMANYRELFQSKNPQLGAFLDSLYVQRTEGAYIVATMARNLAVLSRQFDVGGFCAEIGGYINLSDTSYIEPRLFVNLTRESVNRYYQVNIAEGDFPRQILQKVCKYSTNKTMVDLFQCSHQGISSGELAKMHRLHWLYYASFSPIWSRRIKKYGGRVNHLYKRVDFIKHNEPSILQFDALDAIIGINNIDTLAEELEEQFYENYEYELDEQPVDIQSKMVHLDTNIQMQIVEFCTKYGGTINNNLSINAVNLQTTKPKKRFIIIGKVQNEIEYVIGAL